MGRVIERHTGFTGYTGSIGGIRSNGTVDGIGRTKGRLVRRGFVRRSWLYRHRMFFLLFVPLGLGLTVLARNFLAPATVEQLFSQGIYPILARILGALSSLLPFSVTEVLFAVLIFLAVFLPVKGIISLIKRKLRARCVLAVLSNTAIAAAGVYFAFVMLCGLNYYRSEFSVLMGMNVAPSSSGELALLCETLTADANSQRIGLPLDENGNVKLIENCYKTAEQAGLAMNEMSDRGYPLLFKAKITPKPFFLSKGMSMVGISGFYFPLTVEANVDVDVPDYTIPATMCHELAHTRGFMREDEANYIAYITCRSSEIDDFRYSGTMLALVNSMNKLYSVDYDSFSRIAAGYSDGVRADFTASNAYWKQFEGVPQKIGDAVNNTYLKANAQAEGLQSYGRMVDLLLAEQRGRACGEDQL